MIFILDNFVLFRHRLIGVDDFIFVNRASDDPQAVSRPRLAESEITITCSYATFRFIVNAFIRPILLLLSLPLILVTLGLFILIINALMLKFVGEILPCFEVPGFWRAFFGAIIISIVSWLLSAFFRGSDGRVHVLTHHTQIKRARGRVIEK